MKYRFAFLFLSLAVVSSISAQVTSHAPTVFKGAPVPATTAQPQPNFVPVARVNGTVLTSGDLLREEYTIFPYARQHNGGIPKEFEKQIRDGALKMIIFEELVYQDALRRKMTIPAAKMQRAELEFKKQFATPEEYTAFLQSQFHGAKQALDEKIRRSLLIDALLKSEVDDKCKATPGEVRAFYDHNPARFHRAETYTFQSISFLPPQNATPAQLKEVQTKAQNGLKQAKATKSVDEFGLLAEKISDDDYRVMMGQHKPVPVDQLAPEVLKVVSAMHPNEVSDLIQLGQAYTIIRLQAHSPAGQTSFEQVKAQLTKDLTEGKRNQLRSALDKKLRQDAKVEEL